jgi:hypothetical protein
LEITEFNPKWETSFVVKPDLPTANSAILKAFFSWIEKLFRCLYLKVMIDIFFQIIKFKRADRCCMIKNNIKNSFIRIPPTVGNRGLPAHKAIVKNNGKKNLSFSRKVERFFLNES